MIALKHSSAFIDRLGVIDRGTVGNESKMLELSDGEATITTLGSKLKTSAECVVEKKRTRSRHCRNMAATA